MPTVPLTDADCQEAYDAWVAHGRNVTRAASALGMSNGKLAHRVRVYEKRQGIDPAVRNAQVAAGTDMVPKLAWVKTKSEDGASYSVMLKPEEPGPVDYAEDLRAALEGLTTAPAINPPSSVMSELCTVYPAMDMHLGMQAWGRETGSADYNLDLAAQDVEHAFAKVMAYTPPSDTAVFLLPGDTFHADDNRAETPQSKHKLDVDTRHWKVLDSGIQIVDAAIQRLLGKHHNVIVRVMRGNHDEHSHLVLSFALSERFRDHERVTIEKTPRDLFMMQWGKAAIFAHHGDKAKPQQLALYLSDVCPFWSETRHRYALTGHVHHDQAKDVGPLRWESLRAFCPPDAYAASMGYGARRALQSLTFDKTDGLVLRAIDPIERAA